MTGWQQASPQSTKVQARHADGEACQPFKRRRGCSSPIGDLAALYKYLEASKGIALSRPGVLLPACRVAHPTPYTDLASVERAEAPVGLAPPASQVGVLALQLPESGYLRVRMMDVSNIVRDVSVRSANISRGIPSARPSTVGTV